MRNLLDWKYLLALLAAFAAAAVPLWLWRADLAAHSLHFRLAAQTALQPDETNALIGLTLSIDGVELKSPNLSVFELINDGSKPIATTDFESPIELHLEPNAFVARAGVTATTPKELETVLVTDKQSVMLKPLLLNPGDTVTIAVITSGKTPKFSPRARIAGVAAIPLEDATKTADSGARKWILLTAGFLFAIVYSIASDGLLNKAGVHLRRRAAALVTAVAGVAGATAIVAFIFVSGDSWSWPAYIGGVAVLLPGIFPGSFLNRRVVDEKKTLESKDVP